MKTISDVYEFWMQSASRDPANRVRIMTQALESEMGIVAGKAVAPPAPTPAAAPAVKATSKKTSRKR